MINLSCPPDDAEETYLRCARRTRGDSLRDALIAQGSRVGVRATLYQAHAQNGQLYMLAQENPVGVDQAEFTGVYDRVLVGGGERSYYDRLLEAPRYKRCPYCAQREVRTLDHYLPKKSFPEYGVYFANLVPCCSDCNKIKHEHYPTSYETQLFHPYFDRWSDYELLTAVVEIGESVEIRYSVTKPRNFPDEIFPRVQFHFGRLGLAELYEQLAAVAVGPEKENFPSHLFLRRIRGFTFRSPC